MALMRNIVSEVMAPPTFEIMTAPRREAFDALVRYWNANGPSNRNKGAMAAIYCHRVVSEKPKDSAVIFNCLRNGQSRCRTDRAIRLAVARSPLQRLIANVYYWTSINPA